jgi:hypothetical protein
MQLMGRTARPCILLHAGSGLTTMRLRSWETCQRLCLRALPTMWGLVLSCEHWQVRQQVDSFGVAGASKCLAVCSRRPAVMYSSP